MAAMTMATAARAQKVAKPSQAYYVALAKAREARGLDTTTCGMSNKAIRAPVNFPAFTDDVICTCYNCRVSFLFHTAGNGLFKGVLQV